MTEPWVKEIYVEEIQEAIEIHDHLRSMDPSTVQTTPSIEEDEWDTDGFVIPSLAVGDLEQSKTDAPEVEDLKPSSPKAKKEEEKIYLGPHGAPPSQTKQQELQTAGRKQRLKQKLKEADRKITETGRENKVDNLRELVGKGKASANMSKSSPREWLDPHCHEFISERGRS
ncbi:hypothetical protein HHK36_003399 [Tetracentron sinense]|uniref:Uncharacterized protein n=1 Tax=Tetracentron sinense TaxID=13715 RepID=A0A834ZR43_TETSI|nr:hypothetical protein HHK36_003399 [Tetracentron sinense]